MNAGVAMAESVTIPLGVGSKALVITADGLRRIDAAVREFTDEVTYKVCFSGRDASGWTLEQVIGYENPVDREIVGISLSGRTNSDYKRHLSLHIGNTWGLTLGANGDVDGDPVEAENVADRVTAALNSMVPWYDWITRISFHLWCFFPTIAVIFSLWLVSAIYVTVTQPGVAAPPPAATPPASPRATLAVQFLFFAIPAIAVATGLTLDWVRDKVCPRLVFAIGQGEKRYADIDKYRTMVFSLSVAAVGFIFSTTIWWLRVIAGI